MFTLNRAFISNSEIQKLQLFRIISNSKNISHEELANRLKISTIKLQRYLSDLNNDLLCISHEVEIKQTNYHEYYLFQPDVTSISIFSELAYSYSSHSQIFILIKNIIGNIDMTIQELSQFMNISTTHLYRIVKKTNLFLRDYKIFIKRDSNNFVSFHGNEINIRIFIYSFISQCVPNSIWIFQTLDKNHIEHSSRLFLNDTMMQENDWYKVLIIWQITISRISKKNFVPDIPENQIEIFKFYTFFSIDILNKHIRFLPNISNDIIYREYLYLNFLFQVFLPESINTKSKQKVSSTLHDSNNTDVVFIRKILLEWMVRFHLNLTSSQFDNLVTRLVLLLHSAVIFDINLLKIWQIDQASITNQSNQDSKELEDISNFLIEFAQTNQFDDLDMSYFVKSQVPYLSNTLFLESKLLRNKIINIFVQTTVEYTIRSFIMRKIQLIYTSKTIKFVSEVAQADLVISDRYEEINSSKNLVIIVDLLSEEEWKNILTQIQKLIVEKIFL